MARIYLGLRETYGERIPLALSDEDRFRHLYVIGASGTGVSSCAPCPPPTGGAAGGCAQPKGALNRASESTARPTAPLESRSHEMRFMADKPFL